jgi:hypothetical protein
VDSEGEVKSMIRMFNELRRELKDVIDKQFNAGQENT